MPRVPHVVFGLLGSSLDRVPGSRWDRWRPTVGLCQQDDFIVDRLELWYASRRTDLLAEVVADIGLVSPETEVVPRPLDFDDPWDLEEVYEKLLDAFVAYPFRDEEERYFLHITTGTHVWQICLFLLTEAHFFPGRLLQS
ncbi:MAG: RNA repair transcriptional activator RtcR family protein, partial [Verrucomicrobiota bacterium]